jgi:hypothetical protein
MAWLGPAHERVIVVAGDVPIDWNLAATSGPEAGSVRASYTHSGAALLGKLLSTMSEELAQQTGDRIEVHSPPEPQAVSPLDGRFHHRHAVWTRYPDGGRQVWRVQRRYGVDRATVAVPDLPQRTGPSKAELIVLHDVGLGFRESPQQWPRALDQLEEDQPWILLRTSGSIARVRCGNGCGRMRTG